MKCSVGVSILEAVPGWTTGHFDVEVQGFGSVDLPAAQCEAAASIEALTKRSGRPHRVVFYGFCDHCRVSGIEGHKRKPCSACGGTGRVAAPTA